MKEILMATQNSSDVCRYVYRADNVAIVLRIVRTRMTRQWIGNYVTIVEDLGILLPNALNRVKKVLQFALY